MSGLLLITRRDVANGIADVVLGRHRAPHEQAPSRPRADAPNPAAKGATAVSPRPRLGNLLDWLGWHLFPSRRRAYDYMTTYYLLARRAGLRRTDAVARWLLAEEDLPHARFHAHGDFPDERLREWISLIEESHRSRRNLSDEWFRAYSKQHPHAGEDRDQVLIDLLMRGSQSRRLDAGRCLVALTTLLDAETETRKAVKDQADLIDKLRRRLDNLLARGEGAT